jgi:hypothetical protein
MGEMTYAEVQTEMLSALPELKQRYDKEASLPVDWEGRPGQYLVVEFVLNPSLRNELSPGSNPSLRTRIFEFIERMACSQDPEVVNLLAVGIFENLIRHPNQLATAWNYMGPKTQNLARRWARASRHEQYLPPE